MRTCHFIIAKKICLFLILLLGCHWTIVQAADYLLQPGTGLRLADVDEARAVLMQRDAYVTQMSDFDRSARMMTNRVVTSERYLEFVGKQAIPWTSEDRKKLKPIIADISKGLKGKSLKLPKTILLIKTTGREEGGAAYHRPGAIVISELMANRPSQGLGDLLLHELFHSFSSHNPELQQRLYRIVNFNLCGPMNYPHDIERRIITNPDAVANHYCIELEHEGETLTVFPVLYSSKYKFDAQTKGSFFDYMIFKLIVAEKRNNSWYAKLSDNKPILIEPTQSRSFLSKIGRNTDYIIHPEEIMADNFMLLIKNETDIPSPWVVRRMAEVLQGQ